MKGNSCNTCLIVKSQGSIIHTVFLLFIEENASHLRLKQENAPAPLQIFTIFVRCNPLIFYK